MTGIEELKQELEQGHDDSATELLMRKAADALSALQADNAALRQEMGSQACRSVEMLNNQKGLCDELMAENRQLRQDLEEARKDATDTRRVLISICNEADEWRTQWQHDHPRNPPTGESNCITRAKIFLAKQDAARKQTS